MIRPGLVSVTFRGLPAAEVTRLAVRAGLAGIEWGGDVHVPHGDERAATAVAEMTAGAGLAVAAYGSYYRLGHEADIDVPEFAAALASAAALGAPTIRVWAGRYGSGSEQAADTRYWDRVVDDSRRIAAAAAEAGMTISYEYHRNTLTDTNDTGRALLRAVDHPAVRTLWQPYVPESAEYNAAGLVGVRPWLTNLHVFAWDADRTRLPLADKEKEWTGYLAGAATTGRDHWALLEFVRDDDPEQMFADAQTLRRLLAGQP